MARKTGGAYGKKGTTRRGSSKFTVEGKSVETLLKNGSIHLHQYTESNLRAIVTRLSSAGNKRLRRAGDTDSPAVLEVQRSGGAFTAKDKTHEQLKQEFLRLKAFFEDPTSTKQGWERIKKEATEKALGKGAKKTGTKAGTKKGSNKTAPPVPPITYETYTESEYMDPEVHATWHYDVATDTYTSTEHEGVWVYDSKTEGYVNQDTGEMIIPNTSDQGGRMFHDYDATEDWRKLETGGTETGEIWRMVDSISKIDPEFAKRAGGYGAGVESLRMLLFDAIDEEWVKGGNISFDEARDRVLDRLEEIKQKETAFYGEAGKIGSSEFM